MTANSRTTKRLLATLAVALAPLGAARPATGRCTLPLATGSIRQIMHSQNRSA
jgi:hypothetical protein